MPQVLTDGLSLGFLYAVVALGYTLVYGILEFINFAHSEIFMFGAFVGMEVLNFLGATKILGFVPDTIPLLLALLGAASLAAMLGWVVERLCYRPLRGAPRLVPLITAIGVSFVIDDLVRIVWSAWRGNFQFGVPVLFKGGYQLSYYQVPYRAVVMASVGVLMMVGLYWFVNRTKIGKAMRAVAQDRNTASLMGINVDRVISITFLVGGALGGAAGVLYAMYYTTLNPFIGYVLGIKSFTAAVFGGIGNLQGAMLGGILLGLFESFGAAYLGRLTHNAFGPEYKDLFAFVILITVLIFRPGGLLGQNVPEKV